MSRAREVILILERSRAYGRRLIRGIVRYAKTHDPWLFHMEPEFYRHSPRRPQDWITSLQADGIIAHLGDGRAIRSVMGLGVPAIITSIREPAAQTHAIETDDEAIGRMAVDYFLGRGFHHFAYCGFDEMHWSKRRGESFRRTVTEAGRDIRVYEQPRRRNLRTGEDEEPFLTDWLRSLPRPTALLTCNDDRGRQVLIACRAARLEVPDDIAILGVDDDEFVCETTHPQLSSINLGVEAAGYAAATLLGDLMTEPKRNRDNERIVISPLYVAERQSTDVLATKDREVAAALRFIRERVREMVQVSDVARAVGLSVRTLQQRFSKVTGHSVHDEIKRTRVDHMARLLVSTNFSITEIARLFQCAEVNNISRYFRQQTGLTPSQYRKTHSVR